MDTEKVNILYVDDETHNLSTFMATFRRYYNVFTASSGQEAIDLLQQHPIALILTDQRMSEMTGVELLEKIIPEHPDPIRILMTGFSDASAVIKAINNARVFRYISKPWEEKELKQSIDVGVKIYLLEKKNRSYINQMQEESLKQERILSLFRKYIPQHVVNEVLSKGSGSLFAGELRNICVLFTTINNINSLIKNTDPQKALNYFNQFFAIISKCIEEHKGIVDKFIGGKIIAIFGAPLSDINNQRNAAFCAFDMIEKLEKFNEKYSKEIGFDTKISIGINSGDTIVGNIGSQQYISYTAIGDTLNTASRLLDLAQESSDNNILVTDIVNDSIKNDIVTECIGEKQIRGKEKPLMLYKVVSRKTDMAKK